MAITAVRARRVFARNGIVEDLIGVEPTEDDWFDLTELPATLKALLGEVGRVYAPLLIANARAVQSGAEGVKTEIDGQTWVQQHYTYQATCLMWLREEYGVLNAGARAQVDALLAGAGCEVLFV